MSDKIDAYLNATAGGTDGDKIEEGNPLKSGAIRTPDSAGYEEGDWIKVALRCVTGYETVESEGKHVVLDIVDSGGVDKWQLAPDNAGTPGTPETWGAGMEIADKIEAVNYIFWARARVEFGETVGIDSTVEIHATGEVTPV